MGSRYVKVPIIARLFFCIALSFAWISPVDCQTRKENLVYFPNTPYELNVYKICGKKPGKTLMLIGGIQGNEPGGFLSADLYADMSLAEGNLIVVPRANFYSILLNHRGAHGDMNRRFSGEPEKMDMDDKIVSILKDLIAESDYLLNLHDGSGYYFPEYVSKWRNPKAFGQSIITDCEEYEVPGRDTLLRLGDMARTVVMEINREISNELHKFHFNNTRTNEPDSVHREQLQSATYYALTQHSIPAFGIETSKFLPSIDLKVRYHNLAINAFMRLFGVIPEQPRLFLDSPELKYVVVSVNGETPIVIERYRTLHVTAGDRITIVHVEANYERGLSADILGYGSLNDFRKDFSIYKNTSVVIRKDNNVFAQIPIRLHEDRGADSKALTVDTIPHFVIAVNKRRRILKSGETLHVVRGDLLRILDILPESLASRQGICVNFKGFVGDWKNNTGEDRGYMIDTGRDLMDRYSLHGQRRVYRIVVSHKKETFGTMLVKISEPSLEFLILKVNDTTYALKDRETVLATPDDYLAVVSVKSNVDEEKEINVGVHGNRLLLGKAKKIRDIPGRTGNTLRIDLTRKGLPVGEIYIKLGRTRQG